MNLPVILRTLFATILSCILTFPGSTAVAKPLRIVTDISPVTLIISGIGIDLGSIEQLITRNASPHDFVLRPSNIIALQKADLIIWMGPNASPGLAKIMARDTFALKAITLEEHLFAATLPKRSPGVFGDEPNSENQPDPHTWLHPDNAANWSGVIARKLIQIDANNSDAYSKGSQKQIQEIKETQRKINRDFSQNPPRPFAQFHDAFQYFETAFGLQAIGSVTNSDEGSASLGIVVSLSKALFAYPASCIFVENEQHVSKAKQFTQNDGVQIGYLDAMGNNFTPSARSYPDLLRMIANRFSTCEKAISQ